MFSSRWNGKSFVCVSTRHYRDRPFPWRQEGNLLDGIQELAPYQRLAESADAIVSLTPSVDQLGNLTVIWRNSTGGEGTAYVPANYFRE